MLLEVVAATQESAAHHWTSVAHALRLAVAAAPALPGPASRARAAAPYCGSGAGTLPRAPRGLRLMVIAAAFGAPNRRPNDQTQADRRTKVKF